MKRSPLWLTSSLLASVVLFSGCSAFRASIDDTDPLSASTLTAHFDQKDMLNMSQQIADMIVAHPFPPEGEKSPIMIIMGIQNRTKSHIDTKALTDTMTMPLMDSAGLRFINRARRDELLAEQGYQLANATPESQTAIGRQLGAKYMITGSLAEIGAKTGKQVRLSKQEDVYYQLTVEITELESGLIMLRKQSDRLRRKSTPIIGW
jgi:uncharacterized protein (TIGR02722 family)